MRGPILAAAVSARAEPLLSVLIVTWNVRELTLECLRRVQPAAGELPLEVVLVDNASTDGTADAVAVNFPEVRIIRNARNEGFPRANNQASAVARGRYILYLNADALVEPGTLRSCMDELERDPEVGIVGCRLAYPDGRTQYECARRTYRLRDLAAELFYLHMFFPHSRLFAGQLMGEWDHAGRRDVELISGAFLMARREVVDAVGGLPDEFFMYHEDAAFCLRARRLGWRIRYLGDATTVHVSGQSTGRKAGAFYLLDGDVKVALIREAQGSLAGVAARILFGLRSLVHLLVAALGAIVPGLRRWRERYPKVFDVQRHALQLAWSVWPRAVRPLTPGHGLRQVRDG